MKVNQTADQTVNLIHHLHPINHILLGVPPSTEAVGATPLPVVVLVSAVAGTQKIH